MTTIITLANLNAADKAAFVAALGDIYEHAPWVAEAVHGRRPFASLTALHEAMTAAVREASVEERVALLKGHPDLAGKAARAALASEASGQRGHSIVRAPDTRPEPGSSARAGTMTADSKAEQASAGLDRLSEAEYAAFHRHNDAYRKKFGIPFIVCVRRHSKDSILRQFERRLQNGVAAETKAALTEVFRIGALRLDQRIEAPDKLKVNGRLSTHVLDTHAGHPASGVAIELAELSAHGTPHVIASATTNLDGRTDHPLIGGRPIPIGRYLLRFHIGAYFTRLGTPQSDPPFLDVVPIEFAVAEAEGHYHVPLLVTPWSYSTYRGS